MIDASFVFKAIIVLVGSSSLWENEKAREMGSVILNVLALPSQERTTMSVKTGGLGLWHPWGSHHDHDCCQAFFLFPAGLAWMTRGDLLIEGEEVGFPEWEWQRMTK